MRTAVVTGASSGLGREFVKQLSEEGKLDEIWVIARRREKLEELASFVKTPLRIFGASLDDEGLYGLLSVLMEREKPDIRLLINNAGRGTMTTLDEETTEDAVSMIGLNCQAPVKMMKLCLPYMKEGAGIINVASVAGLLPLPDLAVYGATKAFLLSLSQAVNEEMEERNIHVMALCPLLDQRHRIHRKSRRRRPHLRKRHPQCRRNSKKSPRRPPPRRNSQPPRQNGQTHRPGHPLRPARASMENKEMDESVGGLTERLPLRGRRAVGRS